MKIITGSAPGPQDVHGNGKSYLFETFNNVFLRI